MPCPPAAWLPDHDGQRTRRDLNDPGTSWPQYGLALSAGFASYSRSVRPAARALARGTSPLAVRLLLESPGSGRLALDSRLELLTLVQNPVDQTKLAGLLSGHEVVTVERPFNILVRLAGMPDIDLI